MRTGPNFDDKLTWSFNEIQEWLDWEHPGYFVPHPSLGSFFCFRSDGTLYACSGIGSLVRYTGDK